MKIFLITVFLPGAIPAQGARVRILNGGGIDVIPQLAFSQDAYTSQDGKYGYVTLGSVASGSYDLVVSKDGYVTQTITLIDFTGAAVHVVNLVEAEATVGFTLEPVASIVLSPIVPASVVMTVDNLELGWQKIKTVINQGGREIPVSSSVDPVTGEALIPVRNRVELGVMPVMVPDGEIVVIDPDFADSVTLSFSHMTETGERVIAITDAPFEKLYFINLYPQGSINDLSEYCNLEGVAKWITPFAVLPVYSGYYADAMVWLPGIEEGAVVKLVQYDTIEGVEVAPVKTTLPTGLFPTDKVLHIRFSIPDAFDVSGSRFTIESDNVEVTTDLFVTYIR